MSDMTRRNFFLPDDLWGDLQAKAKEKKTTVSELIRQILLEHLKQNGK